MWKRDEAVKPTSGQPASPAPVVSTPPAVTSAAPQPENRRIERDMVNIGKSVVIKGELNGSEDLTIEGQVEGKIELKDHVLTIGPNGKIKAQVFAKVRSTATLPRLRRSTSGTAAPWTATSSPRAWPSPRAHISAAAWTCSARADSRRRRRQRRRHSPRRRLTHSLKSPRTDARRCRSDSGSASRPRHRNVSTFRRGAPARISVSSSPRCLSPIYFPVAVRNPPIPIRVHPMHLCFRRRSCRASWRA
jgi:hypothetical protein